MKLSNKIVLFKSEYMRCNPIRSAHPVFTNSIYLLKKISYTIDQLDAIIKNLEHRKDTIPSSGWFNFDVRLKYYFDFLLISIEPIANGKLNDDLKNNTKDAILRKHIDLKESSMSEIKQFNKLLRHTAAHYETNSSIIDTRNSTMSRELIYGETLKYDKQLNKLLIKLSNGKTQNETDLDFFDTYNSIKTSLENYIQYVMNLHIDFIGEDAPKELKFFYKY